MEGVSVVVRKGGKYLMIQQPETKPFPLKWICVSGKVRKGETPELAGLREVKEETGLDVEIFKRLVTLPADCGAERLTFMLADWKSGEVDADPREIRDFGWFTLEEVGRLDLMKATGDFFSKHFVPET